MEVDDIHFRQQLLPILKALSTATFVTLDLEMSGITTQPGGNWSSGGKLTLQELYEQTKDAAHNYQVLQVGITCVSMDEEKGYYFARPYNFNVSPLSCYGVDLGLERDFTFSSSACNFLARNGFDFGKLFREGVPYLSRDEEYEILDQVKQREINKANLPDVVISADDNDSIEFVRSSRKTIKTWLKAKEPKDKYVNIAQPSGPLTGLQKRLIYQMARKEFPTLRVFGRDEGRFMQLEVLNQEREARFKKQQHLNLMDKIYSQIGTRWIFEALAGGDLSGIKSSWFTRGLDEVDALAVEKEFAQVLMTLGQHIPIIVGHNVFTDLHFIYKTFIGYLPDKVSHFQEEIHSMFPTVIDTKFMATHGEMDMSARSSLKDLLSPFRLAHLPLIVLHEEHTDYGSHYGKEHEAGFDSWMTAELFVKLSAKLFAKWKEDRNTSDDYLGEHDDDEGGVMLGDEAPAIGGAEIKQWLPCAPDHPFWSTYKNKLRVNAVDGGVCDLSERDPETVEDLRKELEDL